MAVAKTATPQRGQKPSTKTSPRRARGKRGPEAVGRADPTTAPEGYEVDFYLWAYTQADLLRRGLYHQLDLPNLIEELETLGRSDKRKLMSHYQILIHHLLKWQVQPEKRSTSWRLTINNARDEIDAIESDSRTLRQAVKGDLPEIYRRARRSAAIETGLDEGTFPRECPYALTLLRDRDALPD